MVTPGWYIWQGASSGSGGGGVWLWLIGLAIPPSKALGRSTFHTMKLSLQFLYGVYGAPPGPEETSIRVHGHADRSYRPTHHYHHPVAATDAAAADAIVGANVEDDLQDQHGPGQFCTPPRSGLEQRRRLRSLTSKSLKRHEREPSPCAFVCLSLPDSLPDSLPNSQHHAGLRGQLPSAVCSRNRRCLRTNLARGRLCYIVDTVYMFAVSCFLMEKNDVWKSKTKVAREVSSAIPEQFGAWPPANQ